MSAESYKRTCGQSKQAYYNGFVVNSLHKRVPYSFFPMYKSTGTDTHTNRQKYTYVCNITTQLTLVDDGELFRYIGYKEVLK